MFLNYLISQIDKSYSPKGFSNSEAINIQYDIFKNLLRKSKNTKFGIDHNFNKIDNYEKYKLNVPIRDYEDFKIYINYVREGKEDITWPGDHYILPKLQVQPQEQNSFLLPKNHCQTI